MKIDTRPEPCLAPSLTEDDDDALILDGHDALIHHLREGGENREALAYLLRYETMVRQQEAEDMATLDYLRPCIERLEELAGVNLKKKPSGKKTSLSWSVAESTLLTREISFSALKKAVDLLEEKTALTEQMLADRQLMMVLKLLTRKATSPEDPAFDENEEAFITWAEIFQAYKTCIAGMFTLQHLPHDHFVRTRTRERTMTSLSLFEGASCKVFGQASTAVDISPLTHETKRPGAFMHTSSPESNNMSVVVRIALVLMVGGVMGFFCGASPDSFPKIELPFAIHWHTSEYLQKEQFPESQVPMTAPLPVPSPIMRLDLPVAPVTRTMMKPIAVPLKTVPVLSSHSSVVDSRKMKVSTTIGGAVGIIVAPMMLNALNIITAGVTIPTAVTAAVLTVGLVTISAHAARGLMSLMHNFLRRDSKGKP
ncbi:hypothetical protein FisN_1Lh361 [Fistulifera solaris]|uniref:Transmembrane protein n=1 Tax=Fistulifera solaris TaxID=1519565 RepID=A0A1Z5K3Z0_FISSO|nr:hypothetical protein FisN_1Lh361 [Fistulifera solaris]|eukprot:GAX20973.1 hypothetical protein FisN_1Lh361 [Fistulifera solaris]